MTNHYALMQRGHIVNVVTTLRTKAEVQQAHPNYDVKLLDSLPLDVLEQYEYWSNRP